VKDQAVAARQDLYAGMRNAHHKHFKFTTTTRWLNEKLVNTVSIAFTKLIGNWNSRYHIWVVALSPRHRQVRRWPAAKPFWASWSCKSANLSSRPARWMSPEFKRLLLERSKQQTNLAPKRLLRSSSLQVGGQYGPSSTQRWRLWYLDDMSRTPIPDILETGYLPASRVQWFHLPNMSLHGDFSSWL